ncbi:HPF/RaiA family ribosome-associated protein [Isosphaeraceae bacterium EP7]
MQVIVNTDNHINGSDALFAEIRDELETGLERFGSEITRVEVHLADVNGPKGPADDKRCLMEARVAGRPPIAASHQAASVREAVDGATEKLERALATIFDKEHHTKGRTSFGGDQTI